MKKTLFVLLAITVYSCNNPLNKPIFEALTVEELKTSLEKDSLFEETYKSITFIKDSILKTDIDKAKYADLTYDRIHQLKIFLNDTTQTKPMEDQLRKEWKEKNEVLLKKVDSISQFWKRYRNENALEQYVKIELTKLHKEYYSYLYTIKNVNIGFTLTPLKGPIEQIRFSFEIEAKIYEKQEPSYYKSTFSAINKSWCLSTSPFITPTTRYWEASYSNEKRLENLTIESLNRDYNTYIEIDQIRVNGKNLSADDLNIPQAIKNHWRYEKDEFLKDLYVDDVVKDILKLDYMREYQYTRKGIQNSLNAKDKLAFEFLNTYDNEDGDL